MSGQSSQQPSHTYLGEKPRKATSLQLLRHYLPSKSTYLNSTQLHSVSQTSIEPILLAKVVGSPKQSSCPQKCSPSPIIHLSCELEVNRKEISMTIRGVFFEVYLQSPWIRRRRSLTKEMDGRRRHTGSIVPHFSFNSSSSTFFLFIFN